MSATTTYSIEISTGEEIGEYGKCAVVVYDGTDPVWTSEQVDCTDLIDEVSGELDWRFERRLAKQVEAAKAWAAAK